MEELKMSRQNIAPPPRAFTSPAMPRRRLTEHAYDFIKNALLDGYYQPGQRLAVDELIAQMENAEQTIKASRQPVMDALKKLEADGLIEIMPQVGCRVVALNRAEIVDFFRLVAASEALMAELAATRRTEDELMMLEGISKRIGKLRSNEFDEESKAHEYRLLNRTFHGQVHAMAHSPSLGKFAAGLWDRSDFLISTSIEGRTHLFAHRLPEAHDEHESVIEAITNKSAAEAREIMGKHILTFAERVERQG